ncbi:uncharacterized protein [Tenebrio molitor]|uniref:uncharacterized protein isoform X3 n=1 Tax=Tenebrio molitor TaxID=7067 RepID=UPI0036247D35
MENRGRGKNFTNEEVLLLAELVAKNRSVIENKQSGAITHKQKESAWQKLTDQFNAVTSGDRRTTKMLMEKWRNTKKNSTKNYSAAKKSLYKTGGGSKESIIGMETPVDAVVHDIIGTRMTGYESLCDSDNVVPNLDLNNSNVEPGEVVEVVEGDDLNPHDSCLPGSSANPQIAVDWSDYSPALLKAPTSELLSLTSRSGPSKATTSRTNQKWCDLADKKNQYLDVLQELRVQELKQNINLTKLKQKCLLEEHELTMQHLREEHALKLKLMHEKK